MSWWDGLLHVLRDPLFGVALSLLLASGFAHRLARAVLFFGGLAVFIWLVTHNTSFANVSVAVFGGIATVLVVLLIALLVLAVVAIGSVAVMYVVTERSSRHPASRPLRRRPAGPTGPFAEGVPLAEPIFETPDPAEVPQLLEADMRTVRELGQATTQVLADLVDQLTDEDRLLPVVTGLIRAYLSGLAGRLPLVRDLHRACNSELHRLAALLPVAAPDLDDDLVREVARSDPYLPDRRRWQAIADDTGLAIPYLALRILCLKGDWRELVTVLHKCHICVEILQECVDAY